MDIRERNSEIARQYISGVKLIGLSLRFGISVSRVQQILAEQVLNRKSRIAGKRSDVDLTKRADVLEMLRRVGSKSEVAKKFGISSSRVDQFVAELKADGAAYANFSEAFDRAKFRRKSGVDVQDFETIEAANKAFRAFYRQRSAAKQRRIEWLMTFPEWWGVWSASGHWKARGRAHLDVYVMARFGDVGPYKLGNVEIITHSQNIADSWKNVKRRSSSKDLRKPRNMV